MSHSIKAIVTRDGPALNDVVHQKLPQGFALLVDSQPNRKVVMGQPYAAVWTDYFGGAGDQGCTVYVPMSRAKRLKKINEGLAMLGVVKTDHDEFDAIDLGNYRDNSDIEKRQSDAESRGMSTQDDINRLKGEIESKEKELKDKVEQLKAEERQQRALIGQIALENIDTLLSMVPQHSRTSCSDDNVCNYGQARCVRCVLLEAKRTNWWDDEFGITISITSHE